MAAAEKMITDHGYNGTSMREIAEIADVTEKTLYNIYGTKAALIATMLRDDQLQPYLELQLYELLLPYASPAEAERFSTRMRRISSKLG